MRAHTVDYDYIKKMASQLFESAAERYNDNPSAMRWKGLMTAMAVRQNARNLIRDDEATVHVDWAQFVDQTIREYEEAGVIE